ncbi:hypothetical protein N9L66_00780 [Porticoccaceae bacterium]|nr:hypothetical protein [Porticoccaceae bacterium]
MVTKESSSTYKIGDPDKPETSVDVTITDTNLYEGTTQEIVKPGRILVHTRNSEIAPWVESVTRTVNAILSQPTDFAFVAQELKQVFDNTGGYTNSSGVHVLSVASELGLVLEHHFQDYTSAENFHQEAPVARPEKLSGVTYKIKPPLKGSSLYLTVNDCVTSVEGKLQHTPFEIFLRSDDPDDHQWQKALCLLVSAALRQNSSANHIINELKSIESVDGYFAPGLGHCSSVVSHLACVIEQHCIECLSKTYSPEPENSETPEIVSS